jgi:Amt family ammonium transporter
MVARPKSIETAAHAVLCVDDEPQLLEAIALTLGRRYHVELASSGEAALEALRTLPKLSVVVSDMQMPRMNGVQFFNEARRVAPNARRILLTGYADMTSAIAAVNDGRVFRYLTKPCSAAQLNEAVEAAIADIEAELRDQSAQRRNVEREIAGLDRLTGLASREGLIERLCLLQSQCAAGTGSDATLFLIDIGDPEALLEGLDCEADERVLRHLAERLRSEFGAAECLARSGPQTLTAVLATKTRSEGELRDAAFRIMEALDRPVEVDGVAVKASLTIGVVPIDTGTDDARVLIRHAELAAREARQPGASPVCVFSSESNARAAYRRELSRALRIAVAREELDLHYQPIIDVAGNRLHSVEALARWEHPQLGFIPPTTFVPLLEQLDLMVPVGEGLLVRACSGVRGILGPVCPRVSVNVSVSQLLDANFLHSIYVALDKSGIAASALEMEVTETVFAQDLDRISSILTEIRALGIRVALDDFGAGYSSLRYLNRLPLDVVKIDGIFVRDFDQGGDAIIAAALSIAEKLHIELIVEGVETDAMLANVRTLGVTKMQGFLYARPMPQAQLKAWLAEFGSTGAQLSETGTR